MPTHGPATRFIHPRVVGLSGLDQIEVFQPPRWPSVRRRRRRRGLRRLRGAEARKTVAAPRPARHERRRPAAECQRLPRIRRRHGRAADGAGFRFDLRQLRRRQQPGFPGLRASRRATLLPPALRVLPEPAPLQRARAGRPLSGRIPPGHSRVFSAFPRFIAFRCRAIPPREAAGAGSGPKVPEARVADPGLDADTAPGARLS
ncbi:MAG: hypothetical protein GEU87_05400 [Alphaproteobacteria bacterium]|nr:hypothetical protein [Alphaproteobacteria bacterium]